jgi:peroxiredoxin
MNQPMRALPQRRRNGALWAGSILTLLGVLSNFLYFIRVPGEKFFPWVNLLLPAIGLAFFLLGLKRAFGQPMMSRGSVSLFGRPEVYRGKVSGSILTVIAVLLFGISVWGFFHARAVPASAGAPKIGQKAPDFTLTETSGQTVSLDQLLSAPIDSSSGKAPKAVLLVFYRGYWWPFCNLELRGIQKKLQEFHAAGIRPVAISVDSPEQSTKLCSKAGYTFPFLSDPKAEVIRRYDLLHAAGGPEGSDISRPAEFLVDSSGTVRWVNFTEDVRVRAKAEEMLAAAKALP